MSIFWRFVNTLKLKTMKIIITVYFNFSAPELLWGAKQYGTGVDMWAVGCILAELVMRDPIFPGDSDLDQLSKIFSLMGTPTQESWPNHDKLRTYMQFKFIPKTPLCNWHRFDSAPEDLLEVAEKMLALDPLQRVATKQALNMSFFSNDPPPTACRKLPKKPTVGQKRKKFIEEHSSVAKKLLFN